MNSSAEEQDKRMRDMTSGVEALQKQYTSIKEAIGALDAMLHELKI